MNSFGITDRGKVRRDNQDSFLIERIDEKDCLIAVLCDGMGGEKAGNIASDLAAKTYVSVLRQKLKLSRQKKPDARAMMAAACHVANLRVLLLRYGLYRHGHDAGLGSYLRGRYLCAERWRQPGV